MADYGHDLLFGTFVTPTAAAPARAVGLAQLSERLGYDLVTFQDHPYNPGQLDTWTLMSYVAAGTERVTIAANVLNLPLRPPVVLARSIASLDLLSGGRVELGLGAGAFWDAIEASGGRRLTPAESVDALDEAITVIREVWAVDKPGGVKVDGAYHRVVGAKRGPAPAHDVGIWLGAYKPRMLRLVGRAADGWLPSLPYLKGVPADLLGMNALIDEAAAEAGREPAAVRRLLNIGGSFGSGAGLFEGGPQEWAEQVADLALGSGISTFILGGDDPVLLQRFAEEVAPAARELVAAERDPGPPSSAASPSSASASAQAAAPASAVSPPAAPVAGTDGDGVVPGLGVRPTPPPATRLTGTQVWDEGTRPVGPPPPAGHTYSAQARAVGGHLVDVHDHLRGELEQIRDLARQVRAGAITAGQARGALNELTLRQNNWTLGAYCAAYCTMLTQHHTLEDSAIFPHLRRADAGLAPVIDRLEQEHVIIHEVVEGVDQALVAYVRDGDFGPLQHAVDLLTDALLSHLSYEERQIVEPLARLGFYPGQV
jgi:alkanesulfonate monooxygenase SsuD/methylene tetrahydromethanopterin reductase-like flavin-dependent oxidoreductase (luciferase family)